VDPGLAPPDVADAVVGTRHTPTPARTPEEAHGEHHRPVTIDEDHIIREATAADVGPAARTLAAAFTGYPWTAWTVDERDHTDRLEALYRAMLGTVVVPHGRVWLCEDRSADPAPVIGVAGWLTPRSNPPAEVREELATVEQRLRGDRHDQHLAAEAVLDQHRPRTPHWLLGVVGVLSEHRGRGVAVGLLQPGLTQAAADGVPVHLETSDPRNVALYRRLGFEVTTTVELLGGAPPVWLMRRDPG
jgi:ribosomal protein S18 acetylase RimI-like enzyme